MKWQGLTPDSVYFVLLQLTVSRGVFPSLSPFFFFCSFFSSLLFFFSFLLVGVSRALLSHFHNQIGYRVSQKGALEKSIEPH